MVPASIGHPAMLQWELGAERVAWLTRREPPRGRDNERFLRTAAISP
jgi:hypothetical protein